jgi:aspartate aminotransferase-like enzyme
LTNGEFGDRLVDQAQRMGLKHQVLSAEWGKELDLAAVRRTLEANRNLGWLWCTHCETSSGIVQDLNRLKSLCAEFQVKLCLDCISSIGTMDVDLSGVYLASCASGKGLRSYPGLSMVFYNHEIQTAASPLPRYLDLAYYAQQQGVPFTFSSNLLHALHAAVKRVPWERRFAEIVELSSWLRARLAEMGLQLVHGNSTSPAVITMILPPELNSVEVGRRMQETGYLISYNSDYLKRRNWVQICLMGECTQEKVVSLVNALNRVCFRRRAAKTSGEGATAPKAE